MKGCLILALVLCLISQTTSRLIITTPLVTEFPNNSIPYYYANFGQVPYGKSLSYDVIVLDDGLCGNPPISKLKKPTYLVIPSNYHQICSFTKRAEIAQSLGAKGLIIASTYYEYAKGNVVEADDGNGKKVHITVLFISNDHYQNLKKLHKIQVSAKFEVPQEKHSRVTLFISSSKRSNLVLLRQFNEEYKHLWKHLIVDVVYHTVSCSFCRSQDCLMASFCSFDYDSYQPSVGSKIVKEQIHQYTIFTSLGVDKWLEYMDLFDDYCDGDWNNIEECSKNIIEKMGIRDVSIIHPIDDTLRQWRVKETKIGFDNFPQVSINNMVYRGNTDIDDIFEAICASLLSPPSYCSQKYKNADEQEQDKPKIGSVLSKVLMIFLIFLLIGVFLYKRIVKNQLTRDMASRVGESIANYAAKISATGSKRKERNSQLHQEAL